MGTTQDPSSSSLVKWLAHQTMSHYDVTNETKVLPKYLITQSRTHTWIGKSVVKCLFNFGSRCARHNYDTQTNLILSVIAWSRCLAYIHNLRSLAYTQPEPRKHNLGKLWSLSAMPVSVPDSQPDDQMAAEKAGHETGIFISMWLVLDCVSGYIPKLPQKRLYNSLLAAYPLLGIFSVVGDINDCLVSVISCQFLRSNAVLSAPPLPDAHASAPPPSICACAYRPSCYVNAVSVHCREYGWVLCL